MKAGRTGAEAQRRRQNGSARGEKKGREESEGRGLKKRNGGEEGEKGEDAILVSISQSGIIRNGQGNIIHYASVFKGGDDITDKYIPEQFSWIRDSGNADFDAGWNRLHKDNGNRVALTAEDVRGSAVFSCELESE